jgi:hypothetical protein
MDRLEEKSERTHGVRDTIGKLAALKR